MESSDLILATIALALVTAALVTGGPSRLLDGGRESLNLLSTAWARLLLGFILAGLITVMVPAETIGQYLGEGSGLMGLGIAIVAGCLTPGGPYVQFPIVATLYRSGAAPGPLAAYLTAWSVIPINRTLVWEIPFLGYQFALVRWLVSLALPLLIGVSVPVILRLFSR